MRYMAWWKLGAVHADVRYQKHAGHLVGNVTLAVGASIS
jgi:hypothetical protein